MRVIRSRNLPHKFGVLLTTALLLAGALVAQTSSPCQGPLSQDQVVGLLKGSVTPRRVAALVEQCGVTFEVANDVAQSLRAAGADEALISVIRQQASPAIRQGLEHVRRGDQAFADGFFAKAASEYTQAWQAMPSRGDIGLKAARLWKDRGDYLQSARILNAILALPDNPAAADARQLLNEIQPSLQASFERKLNEGLSLMGRRDLAGAAQAFADASAISPGRSEPHLHLSRVYALQKNLAGASSEILLAVKRGNVSATQLLAFDEFEPWLQDQQFLSFLGDVYGTAEVNAALDARRQKKVDEQRAREADARRRELQQRIPQLLQEAAAAEQSAQEAATKARKAESEAQSVSSDNSFGGLIVGGIVRSGAKKWRQKEKESTERAARLRQEASALQAQLVEAIRQAEATPKTSAQAAPLPAPPAGPSQGGTKVNPKDGLTYVWIPAGTFQMGCSPGDSECGNFEKPAHAVTITKGFWMGQTEVTQAAYQRVMGTNPSHFRGERLPVESVTWHDANGYCSAVGMRLPTEAEWEYAARAGNTASRYGDIDAIAWSENRGGQTHEVGQKEPNAWKLYDMLGNVWEWTNDWDDENDYRQSPSQDPRGPSTGQGRRFRGGSWYYTGAGSMRVSDRSGGPPGTHVNFLGFRCAGEVP